MIDVMVMTWALTLARVGTFLHSLPLLGGTNVPNTVKVGLTMALTVFFYGDAADASANAGGFIHGGSATWLAFLLMVGREAVLGAVLGVALGLFLTPARIAGEFIAQEAGLTFAGVLTATGDGSTNPIATLFEMLASLVFFTLDLHHIFLKLLAETFQTYPIGTPFALPRWDLVTAVSAAHEGGLMLAAPVALCLMLATVVLVLMMRAAPQLNLFSVGFSLRITVAFAAVLFLLPQIIAGIVSQFAALIAFLQLPG